jgi:CheY-like chemotaxis protein
VLIADDQELIRVGFRMILEAQPDITVVADVADGLAAVDAARRLRPDVCLLDVRMPGMDGLEVTRRLAGPEVADPIAVVVITMFDLDEYVNAALQFGGQRIPAQGLRPGNAGRGPPRGRTRGCPGSTPGHDAVAASLPPDSPGPDNGTDGSADRPGDRRCAGGGTRPDQP